MKEWVQREGGRGGERRKEGEWKEGIGGVERGDRRSRGRGEGRRGEGGGGRKGAHTCRILGIEYLVEWSFGLVCVWCVRLCVYMCVSVSVCLCMCVSAYASGGETVRLLANNVSFVHL